MPRRKGWKKRQAKKVKNDVSSARSPQVQLKWSSTLRDAPTPTPTPVRRRRNTMPPAASESGSDDLDAIPAKSTAQKDVAMHDQEDEEDDEDEYQVEKIEEHSFVKGQVVYKVKWLGYDEEDDKTWEPIDNLEGAKEALAAYHRAIGGTPEPPMKGKKPTKASLGKRNSTQADLDSPAPSSNKKGRPRKSDANGTSAVDSLPVGSWEDHVSSVAAIVESEEVGLIKGKKDVKSLEGLLEWNDGRKTQHKMNVLRQKCPQRLLDYYESHLVFQGDPRYMS